LFFNKFWPVADRDARSAHLVPGHARAASFNTLSGAISSSAPVAVDLSGNS
jgi:hypothetical protein